MFEENDQNLFCLVNQAITSEDNLEESFAKELIIAAFNYTKVRVEWNLYSLAEKAENDSYRTSSHNRFIDTLNIFLRYEKSLSKEVPNFSKYDRKALGDVANFLVCQLALAKR